MRATLWSFAFLSVFAVGSLLTALVRNSPPWSQPPGFGTRLATYMLSHVAETSVGSEFPELRPRRYPGLLPDHLFGVVDQAATKLGWEVLERDVQRHTLRAVATTPIFRMQDDVGITVVPTDDKRGAVLFVRSASRMGQGDLGANTRHVLDLYAQLDTVIPPPDNAWRP